MCASSTRPTRQTRCSTRLPTVAAIDCCNQQSSAFHLRSCLRFHNNTVFIITVCRFLRLRGRGCVYAETCVYARGYVCTHPLCIRTTARVNAPTRVYAPTPAYKHMCVNAASGAYTHLPAYTHPTLCIRRDATNVMIASTLSAFAFCGRDVISSHTLTCLHTRRGMIDWVKLGGHFHSRALSQRIHAASPSQAPRKPRGQAGHPQGRPSPVFRRVGVARTTWQDRPSMPLRFSGSHTGPRVGLPTPHSYRHDHDCPACSGKCELYQSQGIYRPDPRSCSWNRAL